MDFRNKKVAVVGLGNSGIESALLLYAEGAIVSVTDNADNENVRRNAKILQEKYIDLEVGAHTRPFLEDAEILVVSPGVEPGALPLRFAAENNIPVISELELGYLFCKGPIVAITGTNGKSTVVSLLGEILRRGGKRVNVCGNIGNALTGEVKNIGKETIAVLETSSAQLERIKFFRPKISAILNITEDHLDKYKNFDEYLAAKEKIFLKQKDKDIAILNYDDPALRKLYGLKKIACKVLCFSKEKKVEGIYCEKGDLKIFLSGKTKLLFRLPDTRLKGEHNLENILAASLAAVLLGVRKEAIEGAVKDFTPLGHRFEKVACINGIDFIDDSKATNIDSTYRALESMNEKVILIAGGKDKKLSYEKITPLLKKHVKKIILIGETRSKMRAIYEKFVMVEEAGTLEEAVKKAYKSASDKETVLLSPMCSSFDMFRDYKHRGEVFRQAVGKLKPEEEKI